LEFKLSHYLSTTLPARAKQAGFPLDAKKPQLLGFPFGDHRQRQLDHATPFAAIRWTNIHDPARLAFFGDLISGAVAPVFGPAVVDVDLKALNSHGASRTPATGRRCPMTS
jgi:hypothetical protein